MSKNHRRLNSIPVQCQGQQGTLEKDSSKPIFGGCKSKTKDNAGMGDKSLHKSSQKPPCDMKKLNHQQQEQQHQPYRKNASSIVHWEIKVNDDVNAIQVCPMMADSVNSKEKRGSHNFRDPSVADLCGVSSPSCLAGKVSNKGSSERSNNTAAGLRLRRSLSRKSRIDKVDSMPKLSPLEIKSIKVKKESCVSQYDVIGLFVSL